MSIHLSATIQTDFLPYTTIINTLNTCIEMKGCGN